MAAPGPAPGPPVATAPPAAPPAAPIPAPIAVSRTVLQALSVNAPIRRIVAKKILISASFVEPPSDSKSRGAGDGSGSAGSCRGVAGVARFHGDWRSQSLFASM